MEFNLKVGDIVYCYKDHIALSLSNNKHNILYCRKGEYYKIYNIENYNFQSCIRVENENIEDDITFCVRYWILKDEKMINNIKNNKVIFFYDYFLTKQQYRKLKLEKLNEKI